MSLQSLVDHALAETPPGSAVWVALSGGLDSSLLLWLATEANRHYDRDLHALHINHALQGAAADFEAHCHRLCSWLGIPLRVEHVDVPDDSDLGPEGAARQARYAAFMRCVAEGETLWLAQHRNDQAETFLLAALRGSGTRGLAGMSRVRDWHNRHLMRPFWAVPRARLEAAAHELKVPWIEDPTNADTAFDRNFLRHQVLPLLRSRWPAVDKSLAASARLAGEADALLDDLASLDLGTVGGEPGCLSISRLLQLSEPRMRLLLRYCCQQLGLPTPPAARLTTLIEQLGSRRDASVHVAWNGAEARCWRDGLYLQSPGVSMPSDWQAVWDGLSTLETPLGPLRWQLLAPWTGTIELHVRPRTGGERLKLPQRGHRDLKRLLQEQHVPPWQRRALLVIWHDDQVVAVVNPVGTFGLCAECWQLMSF
ncbi:tRNA lysidine(34) synthetase TilS [Aidingimonas halophila]|uniref:tRNA(Ile)-lysidine synthase n=1 Tax=Aidingimonas halophila TaxID=574349 RepID=A0A1H2VHQ6_9GAMM|nr:tRNA lysidine(34) synthetase TilS [Aidingimonas halophila]GHC24335.1 tRNA(Ile)-lysidine synthase [Aidingimonas halophila]SDW67852.1 tRNA(Ile)-lysidine synthase [Aidingimonas halophila]